jgi:hypothetical protein
VELEEKESTRNQRMEWLQIFDKKPGFSACQKGLGRNIGLRANYFTRWVYVVQTTCI